MNDPDLPLARRFLATQPYPGRLVQCGLTGSHVYGFPSPDSDLDLKGIHLAPTEAVLGLGEPAASFDRLEWFEGVECDLTTHEVGRALALLLRGNGNLLERLLSPVQLVDDPAAHELIELARGSVSRRFVHHYRGFFGGCRREHARHSPGRAKTMLYAYRVALSGIHLMNTGELIMDVTTLAPRYGYDVTELVAVKTSGTEKGPLDATLDRLHVAVLDRLDDELERAHATSPLPDEAPNRVAMHAALVRMRMTECPPG